MKKKKISVVIRINGKSIRISKAKANEIKRIKKENRINITKKIMRVINE